MQVKPSSIQGLGLFATQDIPEGTIIGAYGGVPRATHEMAAKCVTAPPARYYCFKNRNGYLLDPTDLAGQPSPTPKPCLPWPPVDVSLSFVNEPPKGSTGPNITVEDDPKDEEGLVFVALDLIRAGSEIFVDYGTTYDRSGYGP